MRDAVVAGFAFEPETLSRVATPEVLDQIATNALALRLDDPTFAADFYNDIREQAIDMPERLYDARISVHLSMANHLPKASGPFYVATIRWESTLRPVYATRRFTCMSDSDEFREIVHDTAAASSAWYVGKRTGLDAADPKTFEVVDFAVNGELRTIRRTSKAGTQTYAVSLGDEAMQSQEPIKVTYTYRTLLSAREPLLQLRVDQPTKGLTVEVDYSDTDIEHMNVLDFIASGEKAIVSRTDAAVPARVVAVGFDRWVFARSGVAFIWRR
jgi:hypothetical protein